MRSKTVKRFIIAATAVFALMNIVAIFHSYKFTHFAASGGTKTLKPEHLSSLEKVKVLVSGVSNPKPPNKTKPRGRYQTITLQSNKKIECWYIPCSNAATGSAKGTIIICHGYIGSKSSMLDKAYAFDSMGYNTFLVDFMGSGGSEGVTTTIGYKEAEQVKTAYEYLQKRGVPNIYLFGTSMGAVAIMKSVCDYGLEPQGIILECPFGSMYQTVCARFRNMNAPTFPMAGLLVFWGGVQNGFWAFGHNPVNYAKAIHVPVLLLYGEQDKTVSRQETDDIYSNLKGPKTLRTYKLAGHENYLNKYRAEWVKDVTSFLDSKH